MKKNVLILMIALWATTITAQPLTHRGGAAMPGEMAFAEFSQFQPGDQILSTYEFEGEFYASWLQPASAATFIIRVMADDNDTPVKTGVSPGEDPLYFLLRNDTLTLLDAERTRGSWMNNIKLSDTRVQIDVHDNLYYSLCPEWPEIDEITLNQTPALANLPFNRWLPYNQFIPLYRESLEFELVKGHGRLTPSTTLNFWRYWFRPDDLSKGYIILRIKAIPLANCHSDNLTRDVRINFPE